MMNKIKSESSLSFLEATSIIVGHGVGAGILSVPYLAAHNSLREILLIIAFCYLFNILLHLLIAELSLNNGGAQFVSCFESELFAGKLKTVLTWTAFALLGVSVIVNVSAFLTGAAAVFRSWFGLPDWAGILIFYVLGAGVVFVGMKLVGICEKFSVGAMVAVVGVLFIATIMRDTCPLPSGWRGFNNALAMFGMVSFSLSAVMSTPQVVKGLNGDAKRIRAAIMTGLAVNAGLIHHDNDAPRRGDEHLRGRSARRPLGKPRRLGQRRRLRVHAARARDLVLGKHPEPARHRQRADGLVDTPELACGLRALPDTCVHGAFELRRLHALCEHNPGSDGAGHHPCL